MTPTGGAQSDREYLLSKGWKPHPSSSQNVFVPLWSDPRTGNYYTEAAALRDLRARDGKLGAESCR